MRDGGEANDRKYSSVDDGETVTVPAVVSFLLNLINYELYFLRLKCGIKLLLKRLVNIINNNKN